MPAADRPRKLDAANVIRPSPEELQQSLHNTCDPPIWASDHFGCSPMVR